MWRRPLTLKSQFIFSIVALVALVTLTFAAITVHHIRSNLMEQMMQRGRALAQYAADEAARTLNDPNELARYFGLIFLTSRIAIDDVTFAQVVYDGAIVSERIADPRVKVGVLPNPQSREPMVATKSEGLSQLDFVRPLADGRGYIRIGLSLELIDQKIREALVTMGVVSLAFTAAGLLLAFALHARILGPLGPIHHSIRRLAGGDLGTRVPKARQRELQELAESFNMMAEAITERDQRLEEQNRALREANEAKSRFLAMMGHELKTPLHAIHGSCELLLDQVGERLHPEELQDLINIQAAGNHLISLIDNILRFNRMGTESLHIARVDVDQAIRQALNYAAPLARAKNLELKSGGGPAGIVEADETKLRQMLINLLDNAVAYTDQGSVTVEVQGDDAWVKISVKDTGPGIPSREQPAVFEPFHRGGRPLDSGPHGLGLGLAIVKRYAVMHGGDVELSSPDAGAPSQRPVGSVFTLTLPRKKSIGAAAKEISA